MLHARAGLLNEAVPCVVSQLSCGSFIHENFLCLRRAVLKFKSRQKSFCSFLDLTGSLDETWMSEKQP